jgi:hypothetical protein
MNTKLASLAVFALAVGLVGNAYAHKDQVIGDYKIEIGWVKEPPVAGKSNAIEVTVAKAATSDKKSTESHEGHDSKSSDKKIKHAHDEKKTTKKKSSHTHDDKSTKKKASHDHKSNGIKGLSKSLQVDVTLNDEKTILKMVEDKKKPGRYTAEYTPKGEGHPTVHIYTKIKDKEIEGTFHPEKVEAQ